MGDNAFLPLAEVVAPMKKYVVTLTGDERRRLEQLLAKGKGAARTLRHAQALLKADQAVGWKDADVADAFGLSVRTVERLRRRFVEEGLEAALKPKAVPRPPRKVDGEVEAHLVALACSDPPAGRRRWTLRLLADKLVELESVGSISHEGVRQALKKTRAAKPAGGSPAVRVACRSA